MKERINPIISHKEIVREVSKRTGVTLNATYQIITTYCDVIKECVANCVEAQMGNIGVFCWRVINPRKNVVGYDLFNRCRAKPKDVPGIRSPFFKADKKWKKELKEISKFWDDEGEVEVDD